jgi:hypothetical protein
MASVLSLIGLLAFLLGLIFTTPRRISSLVICDDDMRCINVKSCDARRRVANDGASTDSLERAMEVEAM